MTTTAKAASILCLTLYLLLFSFPSIQTNAQTETRGYLTAEILAEKTSNLTQQRTLKTIDLSNYIINLTSSDSKLTQYFYQQINNTVSRISEPINLDFSNSIIQGDFQLNQLGIASYVGEGAISTLFTVAEQAKIHQYYPLSASAAVQLPRVNIFRGSLYFNNTVFTGNIDGSNSLYLQPLIANASIFQGTVDFSRTNWGKLVDFSNANFNQNLNLSCNHFFDKAEFKQTEFQGITDFDNSQFEKKTDFSNTIFNQLTDFTHSVFVELTDFSQAIFRDRLIFAKCKFLNSLLLINSSFEKTVTFRDIYLNAPISFQDVHLLNRLDFSNAFFTAQAGINVSGLAFDAAEAQIIGQRGVIGKFMQVNRWQGNETVFRNLIRNFRNLEQIADANYLEYQQQQLKLQQLGDRLFKTSWSKVLSGEWLSLIPQWLYLSLLLLLGDYGTNISLIFSIGIITIAFFSLIYWLIDRYRPNISQPVIPTQYETIVMLTSFCLAVSCSILNIFLATNQPWLTLITIAVVLVPIPLMVTSLIYRRGRFHQLLNTTYFVENAEFREFRLLIGRLPIMPRFPFFRDRFMPILWDKRWSWLNYYDFSLNNIFKLGFNDIRVRDRHLPGLISCLVWYQWCLGVLYIVLLLWTLSRTIPGLNLLIYF